MHADDDNWTPSTPDELRAGMSVSEFAHKMDFSISTAYRIIARGEIHADRVGVGRGTWRITQRAVRHWLASRDNHHERPGSAS